MQVLHVLFAEHGSNFREGNDLGGGVPTDPRRPRLPSLLGLPRGLNGCRPVLGGGVGQLLVAGAQWLPGCGSICGKAVPQQAAQPARFSIGWKTVVWPGGAVWLEIQRVMQVCNRPPTHQEVPHHSSNVLETHGTQNEHAATKGWLVKK